MSESPDIQRLVAVVKEIAAEEFDIVINGDEIERFLVDLLYGRRELWATEQDGLITPRELASAISGRAYTWLLRKAGRKHQSDERDWSPLIDKIQLALFGDVKK